MRIIGRKELKAQKRWVEWYKTLESFSEEAWVGLGKTLVRLGILVALETGFYLLVRL
jgi:hypothetical protein